MSQYLASFSGGSWDGRTLGFYYPPDGVQIREGDEIVERYRAEYSPFYCVDGMADVTPIRYVLTVDEP